MKEIYENNRRDMLVRVMYADWLSEEEGKYGEELAVRLKTVVMFPNDIGRRKEFANCVGGEWGEFIHRQINGEWKERGWKEFLPCGYSNVKWVNGFIEKIWCNTEYWETYWKEIISCVPLKMVVFIDDGPLMYLDARTENVYFYEDGKRVSITNPKDCFKRLCEAEFGTEIRYRLKGSEDKLINILKRDGATEVKENDFRASSYYYNLCCDCWKPPLLFQEGHVIDIKPRTITQMKAVSIEGWIGICENCKTGYYTVND